MTPSYSTNWIHGRFRCEDGNLMRHDPQHDDPYLETNVGQCPECRGKGCPDSDDDDGRDLNQELFDEMFEDELSTSDEEGAVA